MNGKQLIFYIVDRRIAISVFLIASQLFTSIQFQVNHLGANVMKCYRV
jgi:hypothetical protein